MAFKISSCGTNTNNIDLCIKYNVDGYKKLGQKTGDTVFLIFKRDKSWYLKAKGVLGDETQNKPWKDQYYKLAFNVNWVTIDEVNITDFLKDLASSKEAKELNIPNYGLFIQGNKNLDTSFGDVGILLKKHLNSYFKKVVRSVVYYDDNTYEEKVF